MTWPELVHGETGERYPFNTLTAQQLRIYVSTPRGWAAGERGPGASHEVRVLIAQRLLAGAT